MTMEAAAADVPWDETTAPVFDPDAPAAPVALAGPAA